MKKVERTKSSRGPTHDEEWNEEFFVPPPVGRRLEFPSWLIEKAGDLVSLDQVITEIGDGWLDHWGTSEYAGEEWLVSEPYTLGSEALQQLLLFAHRFGLGVSIQASGAHRPGETMRVMLRPKGGYVEEFLQEHEGYHPNRPHEEPRPIDAGYLKRRFSEAEIDAALCAAIASGDLFAFVETDTGLDDVFIVHKSRLGEFKDDHPAARDVSRDFIKRHSQ
jgi:hypothetical protein